MGCAMDHQATTPVPGLLIRAGFAGALPWRCRPAVVGSTTIMPDNLVETYAVDLT